MLNHVSKRGLRQILSKEFGGKTQLFGFNLFPEIFPGTTQTQTFSSDIIVTANYKKLYMLWQWHLKILCTTELVVSILFVSHHKWVGGRLLQNAIKYLHAWDGWDPGVRFNIT